MNTTKLTLQANQPELVTLASTEPKIIWDGTTPSEVHYRLVDGRSLYLPIELGASIGSLFLAEKEPFYVCRYSSPDKRVKDKINVWLTPEGEKRRAKEEIALAEAERKADDSKLERQLAGSIQQAKERQPVTAMPAPLGNGTTGPAPAPAPRPVPALTPMATRLLGDTKTLLDVYSQLVQHAETLGLNTAVVRPLMISAYINLQQQRGRQ